MKLIDKILSYLYGYARSKYYSNRYQDYRRKYSVQPSFEFNGTDIRLYGDGKIILGKDSYIGTNSTIQSISSNKVVIGENCQISHNVKIYTKSNKADQDFMSIDEKIKEEGDVIINDGVWIGANVFINPGVAIGKNSVIGANSVVTKDVNANCIAGGVPCRLISKKSQ